MPKSVLLVSDRIEDRQHLANVLIGRAIKYAQARIGTAVADYGQKPNFDCVVIDTTLDLEAATMVGRQLHALMNVSGNAPPFLAVYDSALGRPESGVFRDTISKDNGAKNITDTIVALMKRHPTDPNIRKAIAQELLSAAAAKFTEGAAKAKAGDRKGALHAAGAAIELLGRMED